MEYQIEIREIQPRWIASASATCTPETIGDTLTKVLLPRVYRFLTDRKIAPAGPPVAVYDGFAPDRVLLSGGVPVAASFDGDDEVKPRELPGGRVVTTVHVGPYSGLGPAYAAIQEWAKARNDRLGTPSWEVYPMPPGGEPDPAKWVTEIYWSVG